MRSKYFSILIVPDQTSQVRRVTVPRSYLMGGAVVGAVLVLTLLFVIGHYSVLLANQAKYKQAEDEYNRVVMQLGSYSDRLDRLDERLGHMALMERRLRLMTRLEDPDRNIAIGPVLENAEGAEGANDLNAGDVPSISDQFDDSATHEARKIGFKLERVESDSKSRELSMEELSAILEDQRDLLDSTPSVWPTRGFVSSGFGYRTSPFTGRKRMHQGLDIAAPRGTLVSVAADGIVTFAGHRGAYGNIVVVDHGYGVVSRYGHLSEILAKPGQRVHRGEVVGKVGNTGRSTGDHLHYEVRLDGVPVNPKLYILE